ncbi:hypothetical protein [Streptomyces sp. Ag109_G2-15]|uniref:hypothetical protein n=1 Tax=Streptomyces sp. Ag109_G2-15 TaxID=1938850 RepID=UPI001180C2F7|nr:hypothetical protein [Streptomyces sp. Ag109_G2-15]
MGATESSDGDRQLPFAPGDIACLRAKEGRLNTALRAQARAAGATYTPSRGRDACSPEGTRWIEPLMPSSPAASLHPRQQKPRAGAFVGTS